MRAIVVCTCLAVAGALLWLGLATSTWWTIAGGVGAAALGVWTLTEPANHDDNLA